jgi:hypothetical protein
VPVTGKFIQLFNVSVLYSEKCMSVIDISVNLKMRKKKNILPSVRVFKLAFS